ncbi:hypothetical protein HaLaN_00610, partial [Haematococcus lacustris]
MDDWVTLGQRLQLMPEQHPFMQVYASYKYERRLVYLAYYQHGTRYKQGTASIIVPHLYYAAISGSHQDCL